MENTVNKQLDRKHLHRQSGMAGRTDPAYSVSINSLMLRPKSTIPGAKLASIAGVAPEVLHAL